MSYGVKSFGTDGKLSFHSDYSSIVYAGEMTKSADPARPIYTGSGAVAIPNIYRGFKGQPTFHSGNAATVPSYGQGWIVQYTITLDTNYMIPFYKFGHSTQDVSIIDVIKDGTKWIVNLLYTGDSLEYPFVYAFAPLSELPTAAVTLNSHGIAVYDANSDLVFTDSKYPLRVDDVVAITHPSTIKSGGAAGTALLAGDVGVRFYPDQENHITGAVAGSNTKIYHCVPSAFGGLHYINEVAARIVGGCNFGQKRNSRNLYQSWSSFRGTHRHVRGSNTHIAGWAADYVGVAHQYAQSGCGFGGFFGALLGAFAVLFTGGAFLVVIGAALGGFALASSITQTSPTLRAYDTDVTFDTSNTVNCLVTSIGYYGIPSELEGSALRDSRITYLYNRAIGSHVYWHTTTFDYDSLTAIYVFSGAVLVYYASNVINLDATTITVDDVVYRRGALQETSTAGSGTSKYYKVGSYMND